MDKHGTYPRTTKLASAFNGPTSYKGKSPDRIDTGSLNKGTMTHVSRRPLKSILRKPGQSRDTSAESRDRLLRHKEDHPLFRKTQDSLLRHKEDSSLFRKTEDQLLSQKEGSLLRRKEDSLLSRNGDSQLFQKDTQARRRSDGIIDYAKQDGVLPKRHSSDSTAGPIIK